MPQNTTNYSTYETKESAQELEYNLHTPISPFKFGAYTTCIS